MGHIFGERDAEYLKSNPITYLDQLAVGEMFQMSEVQFFYEGPYDFKTVFTKREPVADGFRCEYGDGKSLSLPGEVNINRRLSC